MCRVATNTMALVQRMLWLLLMRHVSSCRREAGHYHCKGRCGYAANGRWKGSPTRECRRGVA